MTVIPQLTIALSPGQFLVDYQGVYSATASYVPGQIVEQSSFYYINLKASKGKAPETSGASNAFWQGIGTDSGAPEGPEGKEGKEGKPAAVGVPGASAVIETGKEIEPSAVSVSTVYLSLKLKAEKTAWEILIDGKSVYSNPAEILLAADLDQTYMLRVKAKGKYEVKMTEGTAAEAHAVIQEG